MKIRTIALATSALLVFAIASGGASTATGEGTHTLHSGAITIPAVLNHLPAEPVGLGVFGQRVVFPQFVLDGRGSAVAVYDASTQGLSTVTVPLAAQGQFAYAVAPDLRAGALWIGADHDLIRFDVGSGEISVLVLPSVEYPYARAGDLGGSNVLGLAVDQGGLVWITRDHDSGLTIFDPTSGRFAQHALPSGVVPGNIAALGGDRLAVQVYHVNDARYELSGANLDTGYMLVGVRSGTRVFVPGITTGLASGSAGHLLVARLSGLDQVDPPTGARTWSVNLAGRTMNPAIAVSPRDGSVWVAAGSDLERVEGGKVARYAAPSWCGEGAPFPAPVPHPAGPICVYPDVSRVDVGQDGVAWAVVAGYNAIGFARS